MADLDLQELKTKESEKHYHLNLEKCKSQIKEDEIRYASKISLMESKITKMVMQINSKNNEIIKLEKEIDTLNVIKNLEIDFKIFLIFLNLKA